MNLNTLTTDKNNIVVTKEGNKYFAYSCSQPSLAAFGDTQEEDFLVILKDWNIHTEYGYVPYI